MSKAKRAKRIFIDYLRNGRGSTSIVPYSVRSNAEASVSVPISWENLPKIKNPRQFTIQNVEEWLVPVEHDPWQNFLNDAYSVSPDIWQKVGVAAPEETALRKKGERLPG